MPGPVAAGFATGGERAWPGRRTGAPAGRQGRNAAAAGGLARGECPGLQVSDYRGWLAPRRRLAEAAPVQEATVLRQLAISEPE